LPGGFKLNQRLPFLSPTFTCLSTYSLLYLPVKASPKKGWQKMEILCPSKWNHKQLMPVFLATQAAEIRRITVQNQPGK
jgi:hypothetical protein